MKQRRRHFEAATRIAGNEALFSLARASGFGWLGQGLEAIETELSRMTGKGPR